MSRVLSDDANYMAIATAIRAKGGASGTLRPGDMAAAIRAIPTGREPILQSKTATENGIVTPDSGYDGLSSVVVNVSGGWGDDPFLLTDYIQSSGTQYIDTGYLIKANTLLEIVCTPTKTGSTYPHIFGCRVDWRNNTCGLQFADLNGNPDNALFSWSNRTSADEISISNSAYNGVKLCISASSGGIKFQGENQYFVNGYTNAFDSTPVCPYSLGLFIQHTGWSGGEGFNLGTAIAMKLYRFRIYEGSSLVMELLPAVDSSNVVCLRDSISGNYFYNQGTGVFVYGTDS